MVDFVLALSAASKLMVSSTRSITVESRRAPIFSTFEFTSTAISAIASIASSVNSSSTPSVAEKSDVLLDQARFRLAQDAAEIVACQRLQFHPDGQAPLQLRQEVGGLRHMERAGRDEKNMIGLHRPVFRADRRPFDERQKIALHALAADIGADALRARADLVDLVEEDDAVVLDRLDRFLNDLLIVEKLVRTPR